MYVRKNAVRFGTVNQTLEVMGKCKLVDTVK